MAETISLLLVGAAALLMAAAMLGLPIRARAVLAALVLASLLTATSNPTVVQLPYAQIAALS